MSHSSSSVAIELEQGSKVVKASVLHGVKDLRLEDRILPAPPAQHVQVAVLATGLCGSDLHYYAHYRNGDILVQEPFTLGHESAGVVVAVGDRVTSPSVGDKVALEVGTPCGRCDLCAEGRYNLCKGMTFRSSARKVPHAQGTLQERINHPAKWCHKLPESMSVDLGALLEPLGVAIHAVRRAQMRAAGRVLVFGAGAVGLLTAAVAKRAGARTVVITDIDAGRLEFAMRHGFADSVYTIPARRSANGQDAVTLARSLAGELCKVSLQGKETAAEFDVTFECTGVAAPLQAAIFAAKPGSRIMIVGMGSPMTNVPLMAASSKEVDLIGVFRYANTYPEGIEILRQAASGAVNYEALVTHRFTGLSNAVQAFETAGKLQDVEGKPIIKVILRNAELQQSTSGESSHKKNVNVSVSEI